MGLRFGDRLDRYIGRGAFGSWLAALLFMVLLFSLIDLLINLPTFMRVVEDEGGSMFTLFLDVCSAQFLALPIVFVMVAPFATVIAAMFTVSAHFAANEIVPMLFIGRSMLRILRPMVLLAGFSALCMAGCWEWVIPSISEPLSVAQAHLRGNRGPIELENLIVKLRKGANQTVFVGRYDHAAAKISNVTMVDRGSTADDVYTVAATSATWDAAVGDWRLQAGERRSATTPSAVDWLGVPDMTPELLFRLGKEGRETIQLSYSELLDLQALRPGRRDLVLAFHSRITFPLANLVLLILALPFAVSFERGRRVERVVFAVLLCGLYLVTDLTCQTLGVSILHPVLAAWLPTILFGAFGTVYYVGMKT
jgi:lipopolysaccharide export system permease protein